jgi:actin-related protein 5
VHRYRTAELLYQPSLAGMDFAGLEESLETLLSMMSEVEQARVVSSIFVCGGNTLYPNFVRRLEKEVRAVRPFTSPFHVWSAEDAMLDTWRGASLFSTQADFQTHCITRAEYLEMGEGYLREHSCSNRYYATPLAQESDTLQSMLKKRKR